MSIKEYLFLSHSKGGDCLKKVGIRRLNQLAFLLAVLPFLWLTACKKPVEVDVSTVSKRTIVATVSESGTIQPEKEVPIAPDVSGEVIALYVKQGQFVKAGELLFEIRPDNLQASRDQALANLNAAKAEYANAQAALTQAETNRLQDSVNYNRNQQLFNDKVIAAAEWENFRLRWDVSRSTVESARQAMRSAFFRIQNAQANLNLSLDQLSRTRVFATMDGTITKLTVEKGQRVVGTGMMAGTEVIKIADLSRMKVKVLINENDIVNVKVGDTATVEVDAYPNQLFKGTVSDIAYAAEVAAVGTQDQVTNYEVKVLVQPNANTQATLRPGMSAVVNIFTQKEENVLSLPIQAITLDKEEGKDIDLRKEIAYKYQAADQTVKVVEVKTGISDDEHIKIISGLSEGEEVVSGPYTVVNKDLKDGMKVKLRSEGKQEAVKK